MMTQVESKLLPLGLIYLHLPLPVPLPELLKSVPFSYSITSFNFQSSIIFQGHEKDSLKLMASYLPKDGGSGSAYQEGGGLYALGMQVLCSLHH